MFKQIKITRRCYQSMVSYPVNVLNKSISVREFSNKNGNENNSDPKLDRIQNLLKEMVRKKSPLIKNQIAKKAGNSKFTQPKNRDIENMTEEKIESMKNAIKKSKSELIMKLIEFENKNEKPKSLSDLLAKMNIDLETDSKSSVENNKKFTNTTDSNDVRRSRKGAIKEFLPKRPFNKKVEKIDLFGSPPLNILSGSKDYENKPNKTWDELYRRELELAISHPPSNYFQHMIQLTESGKIWRFPINNHQGMEKEENVPFSSHVFLDEQLQDWPLFKGPIRHFMELVCVGLSKNHYLTIEEKTAHIDWFKNYFEDKLQLLQEVGAIQAN